MTTDLTKANELLDRAAQLNQVTEQSFLSLAATLSEISETGAYKDAGYESYVEYVAGDLGRSKSTASKLAKVGAWIRSSGFQPETLETTYARLYQSINLLPEGKPEEILSHATTLSESEILQAKQEKDAGPHECVAVCKSCKRLM